MTTTTTTKPVLLQFRLFSGVLIDTALKMIRKRIENVSEIKGYIKARCKLGLRVKAYIMRYVLSMGINKCHFHSLYIVGGLQTGTPRSADTESNDY